jgi:beta-galactosidase
MWGIMNEIFLWSETAERVGTVPDTTYTRWVRDLARGLDSAARREDPARSSAMAIHGSTQYERTEVGNVTQVLGMNLYNGWYGGTVDEFGRHLDRVKKLHPGQTMFVSEYGSGSDLRLNSTQPERFDHSSIYHAFYHESYLRQTRERPYLGGTAIWNQFDFSQPHIGETMSNMNQKGMLTFDRRPKDVFYMYRANWNPAPMVYIATRDWAHRAGIAGLDATATAETAKAPFRAAPGTTQPVDVYTNLAAVELFVNGKSLGTQAPNDVRRARFLVPFSAGENVLEARATGTGGSGAPQTDRATVRFDVVPADLRTAPFRELAVNVGSQAQYEDADGLVWMPDQPYRAGSYGHVGGKPTMFNRSFAITHTSRTGMYFTFQQGLTGYRMDVPDGEYEVELHMVEPTDVAAGKRVFAVVANGRTALDRVDLAGRAGYRRAAPATFRTSVTGGQGLQLDFRALAGEPVLSGIRVVRR